MSLLADFQIRELAEKGMISPYEPKQVREVNGKKVISFGQSSAGYDLRLGNQFKFFRYDGFNPELDPKNVLSSQYTEHNVTGPVDILPNNCVLAVSVEHFIIPDDVMVVVTGKSTLARVGLIVNVTPMEPGWQGYLTIEISNTTQLTVKLYPGEGIAQALFYKLGRVPDVTYASRAGKYMDQGNSPVVAKI